MNIYAHTHTTNEAYPAYISINETDKGDIEISVRTQGTDTPSVISLPMSDVTRMSQALRRTTKEY